MWLDHQVIVVTRRTQNRLEKAEARRHIVDGLVKAVDMIDAVIKAIRASKDRPAARAALMAKPFEFSEVQANHILDLALGRLTQLGREELAAEAKELAATIRDLKRILSQRDVLLGVIRDELTAIRDAHKQPRRTEIVAGETGVIETDALVEDEALVVTVTTRGYVKATPERSRAVKVAAPGERDTVANVIETTALAALLFFSDRGRAYRITGHDVPKDRLTAAQNLFQFSEGEKLVAIVDARQHEEHEHLVFVTAGGGVKRTALSEFVEASGRRDGIVVMKLADGDRVVTVFPGWDDFEILLVERGGPGNPFRRGGGTPRRPERRFDPRHEVEGDRQGGGWVPGRERRTGRVRDGAGLRETGSGRRFPGAGARRSRNPRAESRSFARPGGRRGAGVGGRGGPRRRVRGERRRGRHPFGRSRRRRREGRRHLGVGAAPARRTKNCGASSGIALCAENIPMDPYREPGRGRRRCCGRSRCRGVGTG